MAYNKIQWSEKPGIFVDITGSEMDKIDLKFEVGKYPQIKVILSIKRLLKLLKKNDIEELIKYCGDRLKCLT